jgi:RNA polymerase sigma-70 factor (ECF subfamily)
MPPDLPFADLICRLQDGDPDTASLIFDRYVQRLLGLAGSYLPRCLSSKLDPEDVVQSVFRSFFVRHREGRFLLENWDSLWNLLAVVTVRKCGQRIDYFQAGRRDVRREIEFAENPDHSSSAGEVAVAAMPSTLEAVLLAETVGAMLQGLPSDQRRVVQLRLEGYTIEEIGNLVQCTERTVYRLLEKVRGSLEASVTDRVAS